MSLSNKFWLLRQNYGEITNQRDMFTFIKQHQFVTCPWGGWGLPRQNVIDGIYNERASDEARRPSLGQDRKFVEDMKIGDIVLIPFTNQRECILARIVSDVVFATESGLNWKQDEDRIRIGDFSEGLPFRPVARRIQIISDKFICDDKRKLGILTLCRLNSSIVEKIVL
jgi:hypothetical protein